MDENVKTSSIVDKNVEMIKPSHFSMPTYGLLIVLFISFGILKTFIYIKDTKRHGK